MIADAFLTDLCEAFTDRADKLSLHTGDPGSTGANDSGITHATLTWTEPTDGVSSATVAFADVVGDYPWVGLWDGSTFLQGRPASISYSAATDITIMVTHTVEEQ